MIKRILHTDCPKKTEERLPEFEWDGFHMVDIGGYSCKLCGLHIFVEEVSDCQHKIKLSPEDYEKFIEALDNPPDPPQALIDLLKETK